MSTSIVKQETSQDTEIEMTDEEKLAKLGWIELIPQPGEEEYYRYYIRVLDNPKILH